MSDVVRQRGSSASASGSDETDTMAVSAPSMPEMGASRAGSTVSRYVVLEEVGRGGMGRVMRAYDPKLQREVALKELRDDGLGSEGRQRLVAEARAMAKLSHPNVVAVYDVEALASGEVVLVMEFVAGQTLKAWLKEERPWRSVVARFLDAGRGLVAAHQVGLLHRDFKPANVLLSPSGPERERDETAKVTDFGLAKGTGASSHSGSLDADDELRTEVGTVMGTPRYMAPEQHRPDGSRSLTAAADQYAFCVALWEALCGDPPFSGTAMDEAKAAGPPKWPIQRFDTPRPLVEAVVRGLSPRPEDRWPSMEALLEALVWDPSRRRNRWLVGLGGLAIVGVAGVSYQAWAQARAKRCSGGEARLAGIWDDAQRAEVQAAFSRVGKSYADDAWHRTERGLDGYAVDWVAMHTEACEATTVRGEQSPEMMDLRMGCLDRAAVSLQATVETLSEADAKVVQKAHQVVGGLRPLSRCADTEALTAEVEPPPADEEEAVEAARAELARADSLQEAGRHQAAQRAVEAAKTARAGVEYGPVQTEVALAEGQVWRDLGEHEAAEQRLDEALRRGAQWKQWEAVRVAALQLMYVLGSQQQRTADALRYRALAEGLSRGSPGAEAGFHDGLGAVLYVQGKYEEAEAQHRAGLKVRLEALGSDDPGVADSHHHLSNVLYAQGKYVEAEAESRAALVRLEEALGPDHPAIAGSRNNLGNALDAQGKHAEAEAEYRAALALKIESLGPDHVDVALSRNNVGITLAEQGKHAEAEVEDRAALAAFAKALGPEHPNVAMSRLSLGSVLQAQGKYGEAEAEHRAALDIWTKAFGPEHPNIAFAHNNIAIALRAQGEFAEAEAEHRAALAVRMKALGPDHPDVARSRDGLAVILHDQGKSEEAVAEHRAALALLEKALGPDHESVAQSRLNLAVVLLEVGRPADSLPLAELAWTRRQQDGIPVDERADAAQVLAAILWAIEAPHRDRARARALVEDAKASYHRAGEAHLDDLREMQRWLDEHSVR